MSEQNNPTVAILKVEELVQILRFKEKEARRCMEESRIQAEAYMKSASAAEDVLDVLKRK